MQLSRVLVSPIISESSLKDIESDKYVFKVDNRATKMEVARAVKESFSVDVISVNTRIIKGRSKRMMKSRKRAKMGPFKKATVQIKKGQKIAIFEAKK